MRLLEKIRIAARALKRQIVLVSMIARHPQTPRLAKLVAVATVAYALSPIDLIPDFIPVLGLLDDLVIVPLGFWLAIRLTPLHVRAACAGMAENWLSTQQRLPASRRAGWVVVALWLLLAGAVAAWVWLSANAGTPTR